MKLGKHRGCIQRKPSYSLPVMLSIRGLATSMSLLLNKFLISRFASLLDNMPFKSD